MKIKWTGVVAILFIAACGGDREGDVAESTLPEELGMSPITGTLTYRERIALTPSAQVEIRLLDVSLADAPATTLGIARIDDPGLPPIDFSLDFNPFNIDQRYTYVVRAEIRDGDRLLFTTDTAYPVLTRGAGNTVDLELVAVDHSPRADAPLLETHWKLIAVSKQPIVSKPPPDDAHVVLMPDDNQATGYSGCNRFNGSYELDGARLSFGPLASTRRACIDSMELEASFLQALSVADRYEVVEQELRLYAGDEAVLTFVAAALSVAE